MTNFHIFQGLVNVFGFFDYYNVFQVFAAKTDDKSDSILMAQQIPWT